MNGGTRERLSDFLKALEAPLRFVTATPTGAPRTRIPGTALAERGTALLSTIADTRTRARVEELCKSLACCEGLSGNDLKTQAARCRALIDELNGREGQPPPYRRTTRDFVEDLQGLRQSVQFVPGVGPRRAELLRKLDIRTVEDLLYHVPFRYEDRRNVVAVRNLKIGEAASVRGELIHLAERYVGRTQRRILEGTLKDDAGTLLALTWYHQVAYFRSRYQVGQPYLVHGKVEGALGSQKRIVHPEVYSDVELAGQGVLPIYLKPTSMSVAVMRGLCQGAVRLWAARVPSVLPPDVATKAGVTDLTQGLELIHCPPPEADVDALNTFRSTGHRSVVFDELFFLQLGMALRRRAVQMETGLTQPERGILTKRLYEMLPFKLTPAQQRVTREILNDMAAPRPLHRLVQGDVGSGKTVVALIASLVAIENGRQAAIMAPTELLAEQHFNTIRGFAEKLELTTELLTGQLTKGQRRKAYDRIASGVVQLVVGTHAIIQEGIRFHALGLGVIDEQHRFGVLQRAAVRRLGAATDGTEEPVPDILLMTATPIPRTLAMTVYGDLDISVLDQMPPGRKPVRTQLFSENQRAQAYDLVKAEISRGRQAYVVFPLVESSDAVELRDATTMERYLKQSVFSDYAVDLVHGRMKSRAKDAVMRRFKEGKIDVLVSTTVIEVGIDVPNATVMVIEHADRFGLAQLHQLRGRVGRGGNESWCLLIAPFAKGDEAYRRLTAMTRTTDGFKIADIDLELRGPGELLGTRQAGLPDFRVANLIRDRGLLEDARRAVHAWLERDPELQTPDSQLLRKVLAHRWAGRLELAEVG